MKFALVDSQKKEAEKGLKGRSCSLHSKCMERKI